MSDILKLFLMFFKIGIFTFGGGYSTIPMVTQDMLKNNYLTNEQITEFIGIAESTPGPFAINLATFAGYNTSGFLGALAATIGVVLPSFIIVLLISYFSKKMIENEIFQNTLDFLKPVIVGLVFATFINVLLSSIDLRFKPFNLNYEDLIIFSIVLFITFRFRKKLTPVKLVLISAGLGIIVYSFNDIINFFY